MGNWKWIVVFLSLAMLAPCWAMGQAQDAKPDLGANAAMKYWQAFGLLPTLDKDQQKLLEDWNKIPLNAAALKLIDRSRNSREYLHRGAKLPRCDWSLDYKEGIRLLLPHCNKARTLARLAALNARHEFEQGHWKAGWEDVTTLLKLARHLEMDPIMINQLVGYSIEAMAIDAAAPYLPGLKPILPKAAAVLNALQAQPTLAQLVLAEKQLGPMWVIQELKRVEQEKQGSWKDFWNEVSTWMKGSDREVVQSIKTFEQAVKKLEEGLPLYEQLAKLTARPWKEFDTQYPEFLKKARGGHPLVAIFLPAVDKFFASERRAKARMELFKAALAVVQGGPDKLKDIKDPFGTGPFEYRALDQGFELRSRLIFRGQPVTLMVGKAKKNE